MTRDLTSGSPLKTILQFAIPVLLGLLLQQVYSLVDTAIVGHALGRRLVVDRPDDPEVRRFTEFWLGRAADSG